MSHRRHFETTTSRVAAKTRALIADLDRIVQILNDAIKAEEKLAGVFDPLQAQYSMHARELAARRDNLADTIAMLERLGQVQQLGLRSPRARTCGGAHGMDLFKG